MVILLYANNTNSLRSTIMPTKCAKVYWPIQIRSVPNLSNQNTGIVYPITRAQRIINRTSQSVHNSSVICFTKLNNR